MSKRYFIKIKYQKTLLLLANNEKEARDKIQDYIDKHTINNIEAINLKEVNI